MQPTFQDQNHLILLGNNFPKLSKNILTFQHSSDRIKTVKEAVNRKTLSSQFEKSLGVIHRFQKNNKRRHNNEETH